MRFILYESRIVPNERNIKDRMVSTSRKAEIIAVEVDSKKYLACLVLNKANVLGTE